MKLGENVLHELRESLLNLGMDLNHGGIHKIRPWERSVLSEQASNSVVMV